MQKEPEESTFGGIFFSVLFISFFVLIFMSFKQCEDEAKEKREQKHIQQQRNLKQDFICIEKKEEIVSRKYIFSSAPYTHYAVIFKTKDGEITVKYMDLKEYAKYEIGKVYHFKEI